MEIYFVSSNKKKFEEIKEILPEVKFYRANLPEIQGTLEEISRNKAIEAYKIVKKPVIVEDSGLFIEVLNGFPGPYSSYVYKTIGLKGILKLLEGVEHRKAYFKCVATYYDGKNLVQGVGFVYGTISYEIRGDEGFGFDPIFIPIGYNKTFAEDYEYKKRVSHRKKALEELKEKLEKLNLI